MRRLLIRTSSVILALCMVLTSFAFFAFEPSYAASKASISRKSVTLKTGRTCTIKIRNAGKKVKWTTTNKKIARISKKSGRKYQKAVIKAGSKAGTCYIKAKVGRKTFKCKVTVKKAKAAKPQPVFPVNPADEVVIETRELSSSSVNLTEDMTAEIPESSGDAETEAAFTSAYTDFSFELMQQSIDAERQSGKNSDVLISPESVSTALAMTENGAKGQTLKEFEDVLGGGMTCDVYNTQLSAMNRRLMDSDAYIYNVSNSIWARENMVHVRQDFLKTNKNYHDADFFSAPFDEQTVSDMNAWVFNKTRNMIDKIIDSLGKDARIVLINTVAFEGSWGQPLEKCKDQQDFTEYDGTVRKTVMLRDTGSYEYFELNGGKGFVKYYKKDQGSAQSGVAFVGMLPPEKVDADEFLASVSGEEFLSSWKSRKSKNVSILLPKFSCDFSNEMQNILPEMGLVTAFTGDADFTGMANPTPETPGIQIDKVLHKTHLELDENGTKAAAATAVIGKNSTSIPGSEEIIKLEFNRPFVYMLVDTKTGMPLFIGEKRTAK